MKKVTIIIFTVIFIIIFTSCRNIEPQETPNIPEVNPLAETVERDKTIVNLYFSYRDEQLLVSEAREITVPINERIDVKILENLIKGVSTSKADFFSNINPRTKIVNISDNAGYLFVTLSKEFLSPSSDIIGDKENTTKYLAAYSIVNTLIEQGGYYRVQILIDRDDSGSGTPITKAEIGLEGDEPTEPLARNGEIILNSRSTMREIMQSIEMKDYNRLYNFIAYKNQSGQDRPTLDEFKNAITGYKIVLSTPEIVDHISSTDLNNDKIIVNFTIKIGEEEPLAKTNVTVQVTKENDIWKITYDTLANVFFDSALG